VRGAKSSAREPKSCVRDANSIVIITKAY
jgi:hypothetical protein